MSKASTNTRNLGAAERGRIVQHVLVDGWSPAQAAAACGIAERQVAAWVAAYRRYGMASLRGDTAAERAPRRWVRRLRAVFIRVLTGFDAGFAPPPPRCIVLRRDLGRDGNPPGRDRRSLWN